MLTVVVFATVRCDDPFVDEESNKVPLVLADFPDFQPKLNFYFVDVTTGEQISGETIDVLFSGDGDENSIIDYVGRKSVSYTTSAGELKLCCDPSVNISSSDPLLFQVEGSNSDFFVLPKSVEIFSYGDYDIVVPVIRLDGDIDLDPNNSLDIVHSGAVEEYWFSYEYRYLGNVFIHAFYSIDGEVGDNIDLVEPDSDLGYSDYGLIELSDLPNLDVDGEFEKSIEMLSSKIDLVTFVEKTGYVDCNRSSTITVNGPNGSEGGGRFNYTVVFDGGSREELIFSGNFGDSKLIPINNISGDSRSGYIFIDSNSQYEFSQEVVYFDDFVEGVDVQFDAEVIEPTLSPVNISVVLVSSSGNGNVGMAVTYDFKYRKEGSSEWIDAKFTEGKSSILLELDVDYEISLVWNGDLKTFMFTSDIETAPEFVKETNAEYDSFNIEKLDIDYSGEDGSFYISMEVDIKDLSKDLLE